MIKARKQDFNARVWNKIKRIPKGRVTTYWEVARALGSPRAVRAVGNALGRNLLAPQVPCHRVVKSNGGIGGYSGGLEIKIKLLAKEGVSVKNGKISGFNEIFYKF